MVVGGNEVVEDEDFLTGGSLEVIVNNFYSRIAGVQLTLATGSLISGVHLQLRISLFGPQFQGTVVWQGYLHS